MSKGVRNKLSDLLGVFQKDQGEPLVLMRLVWRRISGDVVSVGSCQVNLPYTSVKVAILAETEGQRNSFKAALERDRKLEKFLREKLREERCEAANQFRASIEFVKTRPDEWGDNIFSVIPDALAHGNEIRAARLLVLAGQTTKTRYSIKKRKTYIGRLKEVKDIDRRIVRRNDVVFEDNGDKINTSVGRLHACIEYDEEKNRFILEDTGGSTGTRIERHGEFLDVQVNQKVALKDRDVIHLGRASIQFALQEYQNEPK
jgi:DNA repair exonuclease SbcCD ATPase subunit